MTQGGGEVDLSLFVFCFIVCIPLFLFVVSSGRWSSTSAPFVSSPTADILIYKLYSLVNEYIVHVVDIYLLAVFARSLVSITINIIFACPCLVSLIVGYHATGRQRRGWESR